MKKFMAILAACTTITLTLASCRSSKDGTGKQAKSKTDANNLTSGEDEFNKVARDYAEASCSKDRGETYLTLIFPDEYIERHKEYDDWDDMVEDYNDSIEAELEDYKIAVKDVKKGDELTDEQLAGAESYYKWRYDVENVKAKEGYEFKITFQLVDKEDGDKDTEKEEVCVIKFEEGWKVIFYSADYLEDYDDYH